MKIATHVLAFGQDKWIMENIENAYPHVDKIYIAYSEVPWNYNKKAREKYTIKMDLGKIRNSEFYDKIEIIEGEWNTEQEQRNECADRAYEDGMDYLIIHDADEFYYHEHFENLKTEIFNNPNYSMYRCAWYNFWKDMNITIKKNGDLIAGYPDICINLKKGIRFTDKRSSVKNNIFTISKDKVICFHLSYVMSDQELERKLETWGHTNDFDIYKWYNEKWLKWKPELTGLHPIQPDQWYKAIPYSCDLPEVLKNNDIK